MSRPLLLLLLLGSLAAFGCASVPEEPPAEEPDSEAGEPPPTTPAKAERVVTVKVGKANLREGPGPDRKLVASLSKGETLRFLSRKRDWCEVEQIDPPRKGWMAARMLDGVPPAPSSRCTEPDVLKIELLADPPFGRAENAPHGVVVVEVQVDARGIPRSTKVTSNGTGTPALAKQAEREAMELRFKPPRKKCRPVPFVWIYQREY